MTTNNQHTQHVARRGELMAELFLQELEPEFIARAESNGFVFDYFAGFKNQLGSLNTIAVEVKTTERDIRATFPIPTKAYELFEHSNVPVLLLVVNVKKNILYYAWPSDTTRTRKGKSKTSIPITIIDDNSRSELRSRMSA